MGFPKAFHPLPFKRRGFHGLKPKFCKIILWVQSRHFALVRYIITMAAACVSRFWIIPDAE
jgi:hypothetical protein